MNKYEIADLLEEAFTKGITTVEFGYVKPNCLSFMVVDKKPCLYAFIPKENMRFRYSLEHKDTLFFIGEVKKENESNI